MRSSCVASILVLALAACGSSTAASQGSSSTAASTSPAPAPATCGPHGAQTLAASGRARVYALGGGVYGCVASTRRSFRLGAGARSIREGRVGPVAVAGVDAAYGLSSFGVDTVSTQVIVRNLATGQQLHAVPAALVRLPESFQSVESIVVKADGGVAWIGQATSIIRRGRQLEVQRLDSRGQTRLDMSAAIVPGSLRLRGSRLSWRDGAVTRTATLR